MTPAWRGSVDTGANTSVIIRPDLAKHLNLGKIYCQRVSTVLSEKRLSSVRLFFQHDIGNNFEKITPNYLRSHLDTYSAKYTKLLASEMSKLTKEVSRTLTSQEKRKDRQMTKEYFNVKIDQAHVFYA